LNEKQTGNKKPKEENNAKEKQADGNEN